jgi:hypothetical protein
LYEKDNVQIWNACPYLCLSFISCKKKKIESQIDVPIEQSETFNSISDFFSSKDVGSEVFTLTAESGGQFTTNKGSTITIPANVFITMAGQLVTGVVSLKFKEIFSTNDIIYSGIFPRSNSNILNSGGEFFIEGKQNGNTLGISDGMFIGLDIPAQAVDNQMELFFAGPDEDTDSINWILQPDDSLTESSFTFNSIDGTYELSLDSLGWGNIDAFDWSITYIDCNFTLTGVTGLDASNTTAFAVFQGQNSVWPTGVSSWGSISNNLIYETHLGNVPLNLVVISVVNGQLYYGVLDVTPQEGITYSIPMTTTTSTNLDQVIENLP